MPFSDGELMLRLIKPQDIACEWDRVRAGLEIIRKSTGDDWLPEDVYMSIRTNNAALYVGEDKHGDYLGFLILQILPQFHGSKLHVWCAHSATKEPMMRRALPEVVQIAKQAGARKIGFSSKRDEWEAVAARIGFKPAQMSYEMEI